jgi:hypothetical protein
MQNQIPVLPITATPAIMQSTMAVRLMTLSTECEMNVDGVAVMKRAPRKIRKALSCTSRELP